MATELAKAYVQIVPSAEGMKGMITKELGGEADSAGKSAGISIAGAVKKAIVAAGIGTALKTAITEGAALEQSIGGIETLFKDSADKMKQYAKDAYQTAGVSANDYMEQATSFSASLLQSVGGDTQKAAEAANQAIIDMADNSNKMGTNLQDIQNAYQGFAKQNYTMLDNLKLGYGGTKEEMARLLADAEKLTGVKYDISNLSDVYQAIHAIQDNLNITGTTAEEAASTLSGSLASMKASFTNLLGYWTIGEDVKPYITQFVQSAATFLFQNLVPAIGNILVQLPAALGTFITTALPMIAEQGKKMVTALTDAIQNDLPKMLDEGTAGIENFIAGMISKIPEVITGTGEVLANLLDAILTALPKFAEKGAEIIKNLVSGLVSKLPGHRSRSFENYHKNSSYDYQSPAGHYRCRHKDYRKHFVRNHQRNTEAGRRASESSLRNHQPFQAGQLGLHRKGYYKRHRKRYPEWNLIHRKRGKRGGKVSTGCRKEFLRDSFTVQSVSSSGRRDDGAWHGSRNHGWTKRSQQSNQKRSAFIHKGIRYKLQHKRRRLRTKIHRGRYLKRNQRHGRKAK